MRKLTKALLPASILAAGVMTASSLYAQGDEDSPGSMMGRGMMGDKSSKDEKGMGDMMGMMKMMKQRSQMMDHCNNMMSDDRPNDHWRKDSPSGPEKKG